MGLKRVFGIGFGIGALVVQVVFAAAPDSHMEIMPENIVGVALFPDGSTPVNDLPVRVWNVDAQKMVYRTRTDEQGMFEIPEINPSQCYVFVGRVKVNLKILSHDKTAVYQHHDLIVVIPRSMLVVARPTLMDIVIAPLIMAAPREPPVVSP